MNAFSLGCRWVLLAAALKPTLCHWPKDRPRELSFELSAWWMSLMLSATLLHAIGADDVVGI